MYVSRLAAQDVSLLRHEARPHNVVGLTPAGAPSPVEGDAPQAAAPMLPWLQPGTKVRDFFERHW